MFFLGIIISFLSFAVDVSTHSLVALRGYLLTLRPPDHFWSGYAIWVGHSVTMVMIAAALVRYVSPQAAGAGVAEMKVSAPPCPLIVNSRSRHFLIAPPINFAIQVIIRGVVIKEYLSFRTLVAKVVGVPFMLASGIGLGKEVRETGFRTGS